MNIPKRAGVLVGAAVLVIGGAVGAGFAVEGGDQEPEPTTSTSTTIAEPTTTTTVAEPTTTTAPPVTLAPGWEDYTPGGELPAPPPPPTPENTTVSTVPGPYGPIYPDGFTENPNPEPPPRPEVPLLPCDDPKSPAYPCG